MAHRSGRKAADASAAGHRLTQLAARLCPIPLAGADWAASPSSVNDRTAMFATGRGVEVANRKAASPSRIHFITRYGIVMEWHCSDAVDDRPFRETHAGRWLHAMENAFFFNRL